MSIPPPPSGPPDNGFFSAPMPPAQQQSQYGYAAPAPTFGGYAPPATFGAPAVPASSSAARTTPELVTVACTLLGVFAAIGAFTVLVALVATSGSSSGGGTTDGSNVSFAAIGVGLLYGVLWGGSGVLNVVLIVFLRQGNALARLLTSVVCGLWTVYWLHVLYQLANVNTDGFGLGKIVGLGELLLLGLALASALPAVLLWRPQTNTHFG